MARKHKTDDVNEKPYRVGYARPPKETQFKANQSGNPKGRPRHIPTWRAVVSKALEERIQIREGQRLRWMSLRQAFVRTALRRALNNDPKSLRTRFVDPFDVCPPEIRGRSDAEGG